MSHAPYHQRLKDLRKVLKSQGCTGFVVPRLDPHANEYIPEHFDRLRWVTGFTGSAGMAIVLESEAAVFVDGRYTLQAQKEVDSALFHIESLSWKSIAQWIQCHRTARDVLGLDPWVTLKTFFQRLKNIGASENPENLWLKFLTPNPVDALWVERPGLPQESWEGHPLCYAGKSSQEKRQDITHHMKQAEVDVLVLNTLDSLAWLLNMRGRDLPHTPVGLCYGMLDSSGDIDVFIQNAEAVFESLKKDLASGITFKDYTCFPETLKTLKGKKVWGDPGTLPMGAWDILETHGALLYEAPDPCVLPKALKNQTEIQGARQAHIRDGVAMVKFLAWLEKNWSLQEITEIQASEKLKAYRQEGDLFQSLSFPTISATGAHGAIVHYSPRASTNQSLGAGDLYLVDSGAQYQDGTTDVTRTLSLDKNPSEEQKDRYTRVLKGHIALARAVFPQGTSGHQLDCLARQFLWHVQEDFAHGTGHGVGSFLSVHEGPQSISSAPNPVPLEPGMILSNEPGFYKEGAYGIRIENLMVVVRVPLKDPQRNQQEQKKGKTLPFYGFEMLTLVPLDRRLIHGGMLSPEERLWINDYHQQVYSTLAPFLNHETRGWLEKETQKLSHEGHGAHGACDENFGGF